MKIIGITGKSGSGKSTFASILSKKLNCAHIDIDKIGHEALFQPNILDKLCEHFGKDIFDDNGNLDRKKIGDIVFSRKDKMNVLTDLTWNYMQMQLDKILLQKHDVIVLEWILLPDSKYWDKCNIKILVNSDDLQRKNKVLERDNISEEYFDKRDSSSIDYSCINFDYVFNNDYKCETIERMVNEIIDLPIIKEEHNKGMR